MVEERHREIGRVIARLREAKGWSQETLAHEAKSSVRTISRLENGKHEGRGATLRNVAQALEVPLQDLVGASIAIQPPTTQLDRVEAKLDAIMAHLKITLPEKRPVDIARTAAQRREAKDTQAPPARQPRKAKGQAG